MSSIKTKKYLFIFLYSFIFAIILFLFAIFNNINKTGIEIIIYFVMWLMYNLIYAIFIKKHISVFIDDDFTKVIGVINSLSVWSILVYEIFKSEWLFFIPPFLILILIICFPLNIFQEKIIDKKLLFNTFYINYPKMFEISMLINNELRNQIEQSDNLTNYENSRNSFGIKTPSKILAIANDFSYETGFTKSLQYKEVKEIKNTNSILLREIVKICNLYTGKLAELECGSLVRLDNVKLTIENENEILQTKSMISGTLKGNVIDAKIPEQTLKLDANSLVNYLLKDYTYQLNCSFNEESFYVSIPMKITEEFENNYSLYDLEIGKMSVIGIVRTKDYKCENNNTWKKMQQLGSNNDSIILDDDLKKSAGNSPKVKTSVKAEKSKNSYVYIDLIAIIQELNFDSSIDGDNNG